VSKERLNELLSELSDELHHTGDVDEETKALLSELHDDIDRLTGDSFDSAVDRAKSLESRFAANHPVAERIAREFADLLAKMGI
jgi:ABC-type transporter Mla subunit MlaD